MIRAVHRVRTSDFVRHASLVFALTAAVNALNFVFHFAVSRLLGVSSYGVLSSLIAALMIGAIPGTVASLLVVKIVAELHAISATRELRSIASRAAFGSIAVALVIALFVILFRNQIAAYLKIHDSSYIAIMALILACSLISPVVRAVLQGLEDFGWFAACGFIEVFGKTAIGITLAWLGFGLSGVLVGYAIGAVLSVLFALGTIGVRLGFGTGSTSAHFGTVVGSSIGILTSTAATTVIGFADVLLVKHYFDPQSAGIYGAVSLIGKVLLYAVAFVPTVLLPKAASKITRGEGATALLTEAAITMTVVALFGMAALVWSPSMVVHLLVGPRFSGAAAYLPMYGLAMVLLSAAGFGATYRTAINRYSFVIPLAIVSALEILGITVFHRSLSQVIEVLIVGNAIAAFATLNGIVRLSPRGILRPLAEYDAGK